MTRLWQAGTGNAPLRSIEEVRSLLLAARGVADNAVEQFFSPEYEKSIHDPRQLSGMDAAADRLWQAKKKEERVLVYGDYDADGITATAILVTVLRRLGVTVTPYLPHRLDDGYALNREVLAGLLPEFDLLISADCGVSNRDEIEWLGAAGKDVIVVDHHELPAQLPDALSIIHPRLGTYPYPYLSGAGAAWKLAQGLLRDQRYGLGEAARGEELALLDLAALGTIADMVPLTGENRAIAVWGLRVMGRRPRLGLKCLLSACRISLDQGVGSAHDIAFRLIPRLNAAGRMEHPQPALDILLTQDARRAAELTTRLNELNNQRQTVTRAVLEEAKQGLNLSLPFVFAFSPDWPAGIVGLVAGRMAEAFARPAIVVGGNGREAVGSARAPAGGNVLQLLEAGRSHLRKVGGHARAAGFSLPLTNIESFQEALREASAQGYPVSDEGDRADAVLDRSLLTWDLLELTESFAPFGEGNLQPAFIAQNLDVLDTRTVGRGSEHLKLTLAGAYEPIEAIGFGLAKQKKSLGNRVDALFTMEANEWRGRRQLTLNVREIERAGRVRITASDASHATH